MKKQAGWGKCPMCDGSGEQETEDSRHKSWRHKWEYDSWMLDVQMNGMACVSDLYVSEEELKERREKRRKVLQSEPKFTDLNFEKEYEPCSTCKDSEFKGCLPIYEE